MDSEEDSDAIGSISTSTNSNSINSRSRSVEEQEMYNLIDDVPEATQALLLPLFVALSLISSFAFLGFQSAVSTDTTTTIAGIDMKTLIATLLPFISVASNGIVCYLFTKTEVQNFLSMIWKKDISVPTDYYSDNNSSAGVVAGLASALLLGSALLSPVGGSLWPVHNIINLCISVTVARAFQLTKLPLVVAALFGLTVYDVVSVLGTQQFTDGGKSIMEAVAMAKIGSVANSAAGTASNTLTEMHSWTDQLQRLFSQVFSGSAWKPGLFNVAIGGRVSDVLGLGDVVFPALLSTWALRFDKDNDRDSNVSTLASEDSKSNLYSVTIFGYLLGCFLCEVFQTGEGQPALLYIVPAMLASLLVKGIQTGSLGKMISYEPSE